jgi:hypothetical protein
MVEMAALSQGIQPAVWRNLNVLDSLSCIDPVFFYQYFVQMTPKLGGDSFFGNASASPHNNIA